MSTALMELLQFTNFTDLHLSILQQLKVYNIPPHYLSYDPDYVPDLPEIDDVELLIVSQNCTAGTFRDLIIEYFCPKHPDYLKFFSGLDYCEQTQWALLNLFILNNTAISLSDPCYEVINDCVSDLFVKKPTPAELWREELEANSSQSESHPVIHSPSPHLQERAIQFNGKFDYDVSHYDQFDINNNLVSAQIECLLDHRVKVSGSHLFNTFGIRECIFLSPLASLVTRRVGKLCIMAEKARSVKIAKFIKNTNPSADWMPYDYNFLIMPRYQFSNFKFNQYLSIVLGYYRELCDSLASKATRSDYNFNALLDSEFEKFKECANSMKQKGLRSAMTYDDHKLYFPCGIETSHHICCLDLFVVGYTIKGTHAESSTLDSICPCGRVYNSPIHKLLCAKAIHAHADFGEAASTSYSVPISQSVLSKPRRPVQRGGRERTIASVSSASNAMLQLLK